MRLTDEQVAEKTKRASEALLFLARNYGDGMARRQYHEISEALHEIDALLTDRAELVAEVHRFRSLVEAHEEVKAQLKAEIERLKGWAKTIGYDLDAVEECHKMHLQNCSQCPRLECCDNISPMRELKAEIERLRGLMGEGARVYVTDDGEPALKDSGQCEEFPSSMVRDIRTGKGRFDLISPYALRRLARVMEKGCAKYGERNWEQGAPADRFLDSCLRHLTQWQMGLRDEDHLGQAFWNLHCIVHFDEKGRGE